MTALGIVGLGDREQHYHAPALGRPGTARREIARAIVTDRTLLLAGRARPATSDAKSSRRRKVLTLLQDG